MNNLPASRRPVGFLLGDKTKAPLGQYVYLRGMVSAGREDQLVRLNGFYTTPGGYVLQISTKDNASSDAAVYTGKSFLSIVKDQEAAKAQLNSERVDLGWTPLR